MKCGTVHKQGVSGWKHGTALSLSLRFPSLNGARRDEGYPCVRACHARRFSQRQIDAISSWRGLRARLNAPEEAADAAYLSANGLSRTSSVPGCAGHEAGKSAATAERSASERVLD